MTQKLVDAEMNQVTIMDTTLRDGEQTSGVSFSDNEKLAVAKVLLEDLRVERIEIASARVSVGEFKGAQRVLRWAPGRGILTGWKFSVLWMTGFHCNGLPTPEGKS